MKDETRTSSACDTCPARCCTRKFGFTTVHLTREEKRDPLFQPHLDKAGRLTLEGRYCRFLDTGTFKCTIYEKRPESCRGFVCHDMVHQGDNTRAMVYRNKELRKHLESLGLLPDLSYDLYWGEDERRTPTMAMTGDVRRHLYDLTAGTWRFFRLSAETGRIEFLGRGRSTKVPDPLFRRSPARGRLLESAIDELKEVCTAYDETINTEDLKNDIDTSAAVDAESAY